MKKARGEPTFCVQVGANDGKTNDPVHRYLTGYGWRGLLVEPLVDVFEQELKKTYAGFPNVTLANVALAPTNGSLPLYRVAISRARWATGLSGFRRDNWNACSRGTWRCGRAITMRRCVSLTLARY